MIEPIMSDEKFNKWIEKLECSPDEWVVEKGGEKCPTCGVIMDRIEGWDMACDDYSWDLCPNCGAEWDV